MPSPVLYSKEALKDIKKLDNIIKKKLARTIERYSDNPLVHAKKLSIPDTKLYRWRAGSYRIIFDLRGNRIEVLRVGHRREIYAR